MKMAIKLADVISTHPKTRVLIYSGNIHARIDIGVPFDLNYKPMAYELIHLPTAGLKQEDIYPILARQESGSFWGCYNDKAAECGPKQFSPSHGNYSIALNWKSYFLPEPKLTEAGPYGGYLATFFSRNTEASPPFIDRSVR